MIPMIASKHKQFPQHSRATMLDQQSQSWSTKKTRCLARGLALSGVLTLIASPIPGLAQTSAPAAPNSGVPSRSIAPNSLPPRQGQVPNQRPLVSPNAMPTTPPVSRTGMPQADAGYTLGAGDRVKVDIFGVPEYSGEYQVLADGTLNLPLVGSVPVQWKTLKQASDDLQSRYIKFVKRPIITITLLAARPVNIAIAGEVNTPGSYSVSPSGATGIPTVSRIIEMAGGITPSADVRQVEIRRPRPSNRGEDVMKVDLWKLSRTGDISQDIFIRDGDSIFIPTAAEIDPIVASQLVNTTLSSNELRPIRIAVVGEVNRPGPYTLTGDQQAQLQVNAGQLGLSQNSVKVPTITRAIQVAGGITQSADVRNIEIRRMTRAGEQKVVAVNFWELLKSGNMTQDLPLQEGDTIYIPTATQMSPEEATTLALASFSPDTINITVAGEVKAPGVLRLPPNTPLNQALYTAGGFNDQASSGTVQLIRLNPNGTVDRRDIRVDLAKGLNSDSNPALRNNDTIIVSKSGLSRAGTTLGAFGQVLGGIINPVNGIMGVLRLFGISP